MAIIIDGKKVAKSLLENLKIKVQQSEKKPGLAVILANDDASSKIYVSSKEKQSLSLGYKSSVYKFDSSITQGQLIKLIHELNEDKQINGILVQLPLFNHLDANQIIELTDFIKSDEDYTTCINHFSRNVYVELAKKVINISNKKLGKKYLNIKK